MSPLSLVSPPAEPSIDPAGDADTAFARLEVRACEAAARPWIAAHGGYTLASHFQPIVSLAHGRVVGHEALLRASDAEGQPVAPPRFFNVADAHELLWRDRLARTVHAANYARRALAEQWLFLNLHPQVFAQPQASKLDHFIARTAARFGLAPHALVLEVLEDAVRDDADFDAAVALVRGQGGLIALDDFGAGHSNFDRVWRLRPEIVKLDRSLVARSAAEPSARRVVTQMVSLLHECGALVLMEGVETEAEAQFALEADVDLVQGWFFARPQPELVAPDHARASIDKLWLAFGDRWRGDEARYRERVRPYRAAIAEAAAQLAVGRPFDEATQGFRALPRTELCYLLDATGRQIGRNRPGANAALASGAAFAPVHDTRGACWASRPYFRRAMAAVGTVQISRPYRTLHGAHLCETASIAFRCADGTVRVVCGDFS
ncbi:MAG TPA: EAL domain-containing protein [Methylibium sp.]|uniref:EAL domain-containing protein n=1 Tax=Methylibium sp. TaxID=2067992 RepID=UPI002DBFA638|nr:EAL domain-containing protein [Methylibium sp.]HEU4457729.1 EAL domain-containing protein [Methylibium sp.]